MRLIRQKPSFTPPPEKNCKNLKRKIKEDLVKE